MLSSAIASDIDTGHCFPLLLLVKTDDVDACLLKTYHFSNSSVFLVEIGSVQTHSEELVLDFNGRTRTQHFSNGRQVVFFWVYTSFG